MKCLENLITIVVVCGFLLQLRSSFKQAFSKKKTSKPQSSHDEIEEMTDSSLPSSPKLQHINRQTSTTQPLRSSPSTTEWVHTHLIYPITLIKTLNTSLIFSQASWILASLAQIYLVFITTFFFNHAYILSMSVDLVCVFRKCSCDSKSSPLWMPKKKSNGHVVYKHRSR